MVDWVQEEDDKVCHPCLLKPLADYYLGVLKEATDPQAPEAISSLEKVWDSTDVLTIAKELYRIKSVVGDNLRKDLEELDCFTQSFEGEVEG